LLSSELINGGGTLLGRKTVPGEKVVLIVIDGEWVEGTVVCGWLTSLLGDVDEAGVDDLGG
jgi:hypothetical protein